MGASPCVERDHEIRGLSTIRRCDAHAVPQQAQDLAQRRLVVSFPDRDDGLVGVTMRTSITQNLPRRPVSGATCTELAAQLVEVRSRTLRLLEDLSPDQLMGPMLPIVNPVLWEVGHVGWFHEFWTLRHLHGETEIFGKSRCLMELSGSLTTALELGFADREEVLSYRLRAGGQRQRLGSDIGQAEQYYYELAIRHEDMHVEALAYMRQTLGYAQPVELGISTVSGAGAYPGDVEAPGGRWRLFNGQARFHLRQ